MVNMTYTAFCTDSLPIRQQARLAAVLVDAQDVRTLQRRQSQPETHTRQPAACRYVIISYQKLHIFYVRFSAQVVLRVYYTFSSGAIDVLRNVPHFSTPFSHASCHIRTMLYNV